MREGTPEQMEEWERDDKVHSLLETLKGLNGNLSLMMEKKTEDRSDKENEIISEIQAQMDLIEEKINALLGPAEGRKMIYKFKQSQKDQGREIEEWDDRDKEEGEENEE
jgi:hypothetical protein